MSDTFLYVIVVLLGVFITLLPVWLMISLSGELKKISRGSQEPGRAPGPKRSEQHAAVEVAPRRGTAQTLRDIGVNMLANLATAAVIYLLAAARGLVTRDPMLVVSSLFVLLFVVGLALYRIGTWARLPTNVRLKAIGLAIFGLSGIVGSTLSGSLGYSTLATILVAVTGTAILLFAATVFLDPALRSGTSTPRRDRPQG